MLQKGNTLRLMAQFTNWEGDSAAPDSVTVRVYDRNWGLQIEQVLTNANKRTDAQDVIILGAYFFEYIPLMAGKFYFEFAGALQGTAALKRDSFDIVKI